MSECMSANALFINDSGMYGTMNYSTYPALLVVPETYNMLLDTLTLINLSLTSILQLFIAFLMALHSSFFFSWAALSSSTDQVQFTGMQEFIVFSLFSITSQSNSLWSNSTSFLAMRYIFSINLFNNSSGRFLHYFLHLRGEIRYH